MKAQVTSEYIFFISIVLVITVIFLGINNKSIPFFNEERIQNNQEFWKNQQIGIAKVEVRSNTSIYLINNHRETITINSIKFDDVNMSVGQKNIDPSEAKLFESNITEFDNKVFIEINYSLGGINYSFKGQEKEYFI